jgi:hypothetical protein
LLGEDQVAVHEHVELALRALTGFGVMVRPLVDLGRETRSPAVIAVSDGAVVDLDLHGARAYRSRVALAVSGFIITRIQTGD